MAKKPSGGRPAPGPAPTQASLREAAVSYLARYATTRAALTRLLERRIDRWARAAATTDPDGASMAAAMARAAVAGVVAALVEAGAVDDATFAATRARGLTRAGRSRRAVAAHLAMRGVGAEDAARAVPADADAELAAAVATARQRRIGPFRRAPVDADSARREFGILARAGFGHDTAKTALGMDPEAAENLIHRLRRS
jgi:regulatory protein